MTKGTYNIITKSNRKKTCLMKLVFFIILGTWLISFFFGCTNETSPNDLISVRTKATYDGKPLILYNWVDYPQGFKIRFQTVDIMIKGFNLSDATHTIHSTDSVFVLHYINDNENDAKNGIVNRFQVNEGQYNNLNFILGVDSLINLKKPEDFPSNSILSNHYYYWDVWSSFIFMKIEGQYDINGDGNFDGTFTYHTGKNDFYKTFNIPVDIIAQKGSLNEIVLDIDIKNILAADGDFIDVNKNPTSHKQQDLPTLLKIFNHLSKAVTVE